MFLVKENFKARKDLAIHKIGEVFTGKDKDGKELYSKEEIDGFKKAGFIIPQAQADAALLGELEKKVGEAQAKLSALEAQLKAKNAPSQGKDAKPSDAK